MPWWNVWGGGVKKLRFFPPKVSYKLGSGVERGVQVGFSPGELALSCNPSYLGGQNWGTSQGHEECTTGKVQDMRNAQQEGCRTWGMHNRRGAGHAEFTSGWGQNMRNEWQERCRTCGMHDRRGAGHEECLTGGMKDNRTWGTHNSFERFR